MMAKRPTPTGAIKKDTWSTLHAISDQAPLICDALLRCRPRKSPFERISWESWVRIANGKCHRDMPFCRRLYGIYTEWMNGCGETMVESGEQKWTSNQIL